MQHERRGFVDVCVVLREIDVSCSDHQADQSAMGQRTGGVEVKGFVGEAFRPDATNVVLARGQEHVLQEGAAGDQTRAVRTPMHTSGRSWAVDAS